MAWRKPARLRGKFEIDNSCNKALMSVWEITQGIIAKPFSPTIPARFKAFSPVFGLYQKAGIFSF